MTQVFGAEISGPGTLFVRSGKCESEEKEIWKCIDDFYEDLLSPPLEQETRGSMWGYLVALTRNYISSLCSTCIHGYKQCLHEEMTTKQLNLTAKKFATICSQYYKVNWSSKCDPRNLTVSVSLLHSTVNIPNDDDTMCDRNWNNLKQGISVILSPHSSDNSKEWCNECTTLVMHFEIVYRCYEMILRKYCNNSDFENSSNSLLFNRNDSAKSSNGFRVMKNSFFVIILHILYLPWDS
ncbi:unnamed protein product [Thelazia callipaeda]|uniref:Saposin B-type domain-containing protein n=1 Tax=Thelazia callipaeda TaxID=103827 RepID=A0A0N5CKM3_THECL|nr:unnamed protein product [Thelazia callipaeda]